MRPLLRGIGKTFAAIGAVALATAGYVWVTLPDVRPLKSENPKTTAWMRMRAAEAERAGKPLQFSQQWVSYSKISPSLKRAVLVAEDASFLQHDGVDYDELRAAIELDWNRGEFAARRVDDHAAAGEESLSVAVAQPVSQARRALHHAAARSSS